MDNNARNCKRGGRPKKEVLRDKFAGVWFTKEEYEIVKKRALQTRLTVSRFLQQAALKVTVTGRITAEQNEYLKQLAGMGRNLNQIAHKGNAEGFLPAMAEFIKYREQLNEIIRKLSV